MRPISHYGAGKLAREAFVSSFSNLHNFQVWIARFCNAVGPNMTVGVILDLIRKIKQHPTELEVYGDGTQTKPFIWIDDLVDGVMCLINKTHDPYNAYLVGVDSNVTVERIAQIVMEELGVQVPIKYTGDYKGSRGDVHKYSYDITRLRMFGWIPQYTSEEAIKKGCPNEYLDFSICAATEPTGLYAQSEALNDSRYLQSTAQLWGLSV